MVQFYVSELDDSINGQEEYITGIMTDTANSAMQGEGNSQGSVAEVDELAKGMGMNVVLLKRAKALLENYDGTNSAQLLEDLKALEATRAAADMPTEDIKDCQAYRDFAARFCEVDDGDEVVCANDGVAQTDSLTAAPLVFEDGRWPVALGCGHVYNWSTVKAKRSNGEWQLKSCAVPGCTKGKTIPSTLKEREKLKDDPRVKHMLKKKQRSGRESSGKETVMLDED